MPEINNHLPHEVQQLHESEMITGIPDRVRNTTTNEASERPVYEYDSDQSITPHPYIESTKDDIEPSWDYTTHAVGRFGENYGGRELIGRDGKIDGGVYYGTYGGEAIVVDTEKYPEQFDHYFDRVMQKATDADGVVKRSLVLRAVFDTVTENMAYSQEGVDRILQEIAEGQGEDSFRDGTKVSLTEFMQDGVGVCRHQALVAGIMLEKMKAAGTIRGDISVDRNMTWSPKGEPSGHAWVRYTSNNGQVMILDIAQGYFGLLEDSEGVKHGWDYLRPEEKKHRAAHDVGQVVIPETAQL